MSNRFDNFDYDGLVVFALLAFAFVGIAYWAGLLYGLVFVCGCNGGTP